jgi:hypothetical protein
MLQTVQRRKGFCGERRDVTDSARGKVVGGESRDVTLLQVGKGLLGGDMMLQTGQSGKRS